MTCEEIKPLLAEYWNGALDQSQRSEVEQHLEECDACRSEARRLEALWQDLTLLPR